MEPLGDYIGGQFVLPEGQPLRSVNPALDGLTVLETQVSVDHVALACEAAAAASGAWMMRSMEDRFVQMCKLRDAIAARKDYIADAILLETGKIRAEAAGEVGALLSRFDLVMKLVTADLVEGELKGYPGEQLRFHPLGVVGVIGPFNYPLHLCHAHVVPALLTGNAVVIKPSEVAPLAAQRYAEAVAAADLPPGLLNIVQGAGASGAALVADPRVRGICFTGSYAIGRKLQEQNLVRPELLLALEMGGKNTVIVHDDADIRQAAHEIVVGGYLTAGQRCTATDRVLVHRSRKQALIDALRPMVSSLTFGDPDSADSFAGPLATIGGRDRFEAAIAAARSGGAEPIVEGGRLPGGFFMSASLHVVPDGNHELVGYTDTELFGPDVGIETFEDDDEAIAVVRGSPFGFANSVFTFSDERFERFYRETASGILNRNRSTNQASPRLPFGGFGRSGNFRPAGAYAARNVVAPVAVQKNVIGRVQIHPMLTDHMPPPELDRLEAQQEAEEIEEAKRNLIDTPRPMAMKSPAGGVMPKSSAWLARLYAGDRVVREKKPAVFDHLRSAGPWFVSIDDEPLSVLDGMSQTATLCGGFAEEEVVQAYVEDGFGSSLVQSTDTSVVDSEHAQAYATVLRHLVPGLPHVTFTNSGAEANEKALTLCRVNCERPQAAKILAFEGSFHGRTLLALHCTHNPKKREPYQIDGYECTFAPYPVWNEPTHEEPRAPSGFYAAAGSGEIGELVNRFGDADEDSLLSAEVTSLVAVADALATNDYFACTVEPMQSEGGDRYATARFHRALRLLTRHHKVFLIYDEVQTGFALGGSFVWHTDFQLVNFRGQPDFPDAIAFAKRAQVGVVMSQFEDPEPTSAHTASLVRGRIHAEMVSTAHTAERIQSLVEPRLKVLAQGFPHLVGSPRARGYAFAFDLPSPDDLKAYLGQRFWRGAIVFGAGTQTVRYRLSEGFHLREIELLFESVRRSLAWLDAHPGAQPPAWEDRAAVADATRRQFEVRIRTVDTQEAATLLPPILDIELRIYEPARQTPPEDLKEALLDPEGITTIAEVNQDGDWHFIGFALGRPLERHPTHEEGPDRDPMLGRDNTLYSISLTVAPEYQGAGIGRKLKIEQLREAAGRRREDGSPRYRYVTGRNRIGLTPRMTHLNRVFGSHMVCVLTGQYEDPEGRAIYYRIPLPPIAPDRTDLPERSTTLDLRQGIARPFAEPPKSLREAESRGSLYGPAVNKLTVMNYTTPAIVRALEWVSALMPKLPHLYLTSSRDELVDKSLRILRYHRGAAQTPIGFAGGYVGHTTAAARSISDPLVHRQGPAHFDWPRVPHPADVGVEKCVRAIRAAVDSAGGSDRVMGLFYEPIQERTGLVVPDDFWPAAATLREDLGLPFVAVETASACYRSGRGAFASTGGSFVPDLLVWWGGAQTGYIHTASRWRVSTPLTMVSTWDGDELSLIREHHQLRAARFVDVAVASAALDEALAEVTSHGIGLYRVIDGGERADEIAEALEGRGLLLRRFPGGRLAVIPALDQASDVASRLGRALREIL